MCKNGASGPVSVLLLRCWHVLIDWSSSYCVNPYAIVVDVLSSYCVCYYLCPCHNTDAVIHSNVYTGDDIAFQIINPSHHDKTDTL